MLGGERQLPVIVAQGIIALAVLIAATFLAFFDKLDGAAVTALFGMAIALAGNTAAQVAHGNMPAPHTTPTRVTTPQGVTVETNGAIGASEAHGGAVP